MLGPFHYRVFGLRIRSEIELPDLTACDPRPCDVEISVGKVPAGQEPAIAFNIEGVGSYWIGDGSKIIVSPEPGVPVRNVRLYLLGSAMGVILHQRGILPLHANAIGKGTRAFAVMGKTGAGKSTLAAAFHDNGFRVIGDDVCALSFDESGRPWINAGIPRLRLSRDAVLASGRDPANFRRSFAGDDDYEKYDVPLGTTEGQPALLAASYVLTDGEAIEIQSLGGVDASEAVFAHTYRGHLVAATGSAEQHWAAAMRLVRSAPVFRLVRPRSLERLDALRTRVAAHFEALG